MHLPVEQVLGIRPCYYLRFWQRFEPVIPAGGAIGGRLGGVAEAGEDPGTIRSRANFAAGL